MRKLALAVLILSFGVPLSNVFADSTPAGFTNAINVSSPGGNSTIPQLAVSGNNVYLGWVNNAAGRFGAMFAKSDNGGSTFGKEADLGTIGGAPDNIRILGSQGNVYAVWQSYSANKSSIAFAKSSDNGTTFRPPVRVSDPSKDSAFPQISAYGNNVYIAWLERTTGDVTNVLFAKSSDGGATFGTPIAITSHNGTSGIPKIYASQNRVYLMWEDNGAKNFDVFLDTSSDSGNTFGTPVNISNNAGDSGAPQMVIDGNNVYAVWMDDTSGNFDVLFSKSTDGGQTFAKPVNVSGDTQESGYAQLAIAGNNVYLVWTNAVTGKNYDIFFAKSTDGGQTFSQPLNISNSPGASGWPQVAVDGNVYVSWVDNTPGHFDVYIAKSTDDGTSFESPVDVNNNAGGSWYNQMVVSSNTVYLAWLGEGNGSSNIMFSKSTTFVPEFGPIAPLILLVSVLSIVMISKRSVLKAQI
ncbi:MAG: PEFG-CTERM sorting domain-containing protein [Thaumarchaeota archaeon]|nr:PEFG-CTERM sorting domain-containing protein [Nitrososphaerota archaeon]